jgi:hypothetical protein
MAVQTLTLRFDGCDLSDANRYAEDLRRTLLEAEPRLSVERVRADATAMDFGATLVLVLAAPAVVAAVEAIKVWLVRNNQASVSVWTKDGKVVAQGLESKDVPSVVSAINGGLK